MENIALETKKTFDAPLEKVWKAWAEPEQLSEWFSPETMKTIVDKMEFKEGGNYRIIMQNSEGKDHVAVGTYKKISPMNELVFTWKWEGSEDEDTLITLQLAEIDSGTEMNFKHERFDTEKARDMHNEGWISTFKKLSTLLK